MHFFFFDIVENVGGWIHVHKPHVRHALFVWSGHALYLQKVSLLEFKVYNGKHVMTFLGRKWIALFTLPLLYMTL